MLPKHWGEEDRIFEDRSNPTAAAYKHDQSERGVWGDPNLPQGDRWFKKDQGSDFRIRDQIFKMTEIEFLFSTNLKYLKPHTMVDNDGFSFFEKVIT